MAPETRDTGGASPRLEIAICKGAFAGPISGADETLVTYAVELHRSGQRVTVLLLYPFAENDAYYRRLMEAGVPVRTILPRASLFLFLQKLRAAATHFLFMFVLLSRFPGHVRRIWQAILSGVSGLYYRRCRAFFEANRFDVLHVITPGGGTPVIIRAAADAGTPVLYQELGTPFHQPGLGASYERLAKVTSLCRLVTALSPRLARQWTRKLPHPVTIEVLPLAVTEPKEWSVPRRAFPYSVVFGFAGRLESAKGPTILIEAFAEFDRRFEGGYLRLAGMGPQTYRARAQARGLGLTDKLEFSGEYGGVDGRSVFFRTIDIFVLPTFAEGTPNSIVEAMAAGIPIIASGVGGIPDMITQDEGILVPPGEPVALANAMLRLARDPALRARMGQAARKRYETLFAPAAVLPLLTRTYAKVASGGTDLAAAGGGAGTADRHPWAERLPAVRT